MGVFDRRAGQVLGLRLDLLPQPSEARFVTAFLFDKSGNALTPASVELTDIGNGAHVEDTQVMQSVQQMVAKYIVYLDAARTQVDNEEYLGGVDVFDLDELVPAQLPSEVSLTAEINDVELGADVGDLTLDAEVDGQELTGEIDEIEDDFAVNQAVDELSTNTKQPSLEAEIE